MQRQRPQVGTDEARGAGLRPGLVEQQGAAIYAQRMWMALLDERGEVAAEAATQVGDRLSRLYLREMQRDGDVVPREPGRSVAPRGLQEDAVGYRIHSSAHRSRPPMTRPSARPFSVR